MEHKPLQSSNLESCGYDPASKTLEIKFRGSGKTYSYSGVPYDVHAKLLLAQSPGKFFLQNVKPHYDAKEVRP